MKTLPAYKKENAGPGGDGFRNLPYDTVITLILVVCFSFLNPPNLCFKYFSIFLQLPCLKTETQISGKAGCE